MSGYKFTILLILVWITTGCQQAYHNTPSNTFAIEPVNPINVPQEADAPENSSSSKENQTASNPEKAELEITTSESMNIEEAPSLKNTTKGNTSLSSSEQACQHTRSQHQ